MARLETITIITLLHEITHILTSKWFPLWQNLTPTGCGGLDSGESGKEFEYDFLGGMLSLECKLEDIKRLDKVRSVVLFGRPLMVQGFLATSTFSISEWQAKFSSQFCKSPP